MSTGGNGNENENGALVISMDNYDPTPPEPTNDKGQRPLPTSTYYWECPNIWFESPGTAQQAAPGKPPTPATLKQWTVNAGDQVFVAVEVFNNSDFDASNVTVEAWICNPSLAVIPPLAVSGAAPMTGTAATIPAGTSSVVRCTNTPPWTAEAEGGATDPSHLCIIANVFGTLGTDGRGTVPDGEGSLFPYDPTALHFQPLQDSHNGQRNIHVDALSGGQGIQGMRRPVFVFNTTDRETEFFVSMIQLTGAAVLTPTVLAQWQSGCDGQIPVHPASNPPTLFGISGPDFAACPRVKVTIPPNGCVTLTIEVDIAPGEPVGSLYSFQVLQEDAQNNVLGGLRVVTVVVP